MSYSVFNGGKRLRPALVYAAAQALGRVGELTDRAAASVECMHVYSLIHDDLPAMDDDALRRGQPSCHIAYDEATAILAGDALQSEAFRILAESREPQALALIGELARAGGTEGMVTGQVLDLAAEGNPDIDLDSLAKIHRAKTGALITASVRMGAISAAASEIELDALTRYAEAIGLAFQVHDDVLDVIADTEVLGKPQGSDQQSCKATYVSLLGLEQAKLQALTLCADAKAALQGFNGSAHMLSMIADYAIERSH